MKLSIKVQLKLTPEQEKLLYETASATRFAYNWAKVYSDDYYQKHNKTINESDLRKEFTKLKKDPNYNWLNNIPNDATKQAIRNYCKARNDYFKGKAKKPRFKRKKDFKDSFYNDVQKIEITETKVRLSVIGWVDLCEHGRLPNYKFSSSKGKIIIGNPIYNPTISYNGQYWFLSIAIETNIIEQELIKDKRIGIDLGLKDFATVCIKEKKNNKIIYSYKKYKSKKKEFKKLMKKKKKLDRKISKRNEEYKKIMKGGKSITKSKNYFKLLKKRRKLSTKITNVQKNYIYKIVSSLVKAKPECIIIEDLNVKGMMKNKYLSKWVSFNMFHEFKRILEYKCILYGIPLIITDRFYPSTQTCSRCNHKLEKEQKLKLSDRKFICPICGYIKDRDENAAKNLCNYIV